VTNNITISKGLPWLAAMAGGVLAFLGYAGFDRFYLEWICLIPILWAIRDKSPARAFFLGWVAGLVGHAGGFYWIIYMFQEFAGMPLLPSFLGLVLLAAANGIIFAVWAWGTRLIVRETGWSVIWVSPVIWTALETFWPEVFPNYLGASQYQLTLLTQIADIAGVLGLTFLVVYINSFLYALIERRIEKKPFVWRPAAVFAVVAVLVLTYGAVRLHQVDQSAAAAEKLSVGLVQVNLGMGEKHSDRDRFLREHQEMSRKLLFENKIDLLVWPENILSAHLTTRDGSIPPDELGHLGASVLFGVIVRTGNPDNPQYYNSAILVAPTGRILGTYDKMVLVPFGEYIPLGDIFPGLYSWSPYSSRFEFGRNIEPLMFRGRPVSVSVCYEDIFPSQIRLLMKGGRDGRIPEAMFNLTDDSWYGNTVEPTEHLALATFRAIEHRRPLVRSTTTGISAIVDPAGRLVSRTGQWTKETLVGRIPLMQGRTIYALLGDWLGWFCAATGLAGMARVYQLSRRRRLEGPVGKGSTEGGRDRHSLKS